MRPEYEHGEGATGPDSPARSSPVIDAHMHLGECNVFDLTVTVDDLLRPLTNGLIDVGIVQPFPGCPDPSAVHDRIAELGQTLPGRVFGIASVNPHVGRAAYRSEARRCIEDLGFVALKLHTVGHAVNPLHRDGRLVFETAAELGVPVMVHTGPGIPFSLPALVLPLTKEYPDTPIVLAHAGYAVYTPEAIAVAQMSPNIYLETSWTTSAQLNAMARVVGVDRIMFGSDLLINIPTELTKYRTVITDPGSSSRVLTGTASTVFSLPSRGTGGS